MDGTANHPTILRQVDPVSRKRQRRSGYASDNDLADFIDDGPIADDWMPSSSQAAPMANGGKFRFDPLTNLILLSGPISSGKTCSVYATAKELGYAVFEVSPNQPRGFKDLLAAVGEVGRNHLVWKSNKHEQHIKKGGVMDFFQNAAAKSKEKGKDKATDQNGESGNTVQQSLILIEEVDILFPDDKSHGSFWDGKFGTTFRLHARRSLKKNIQA